MIAVVNYADLAYKGTQNYCTKTAYKFGADQVFEYGPEDIDSVFRVKYKNILSQKRGGGYWLWKPYIINKALDLLNDGDFLLYVDSGCYFIDKISIITNYMEAQNEDIISFAVPFIEKQWTKKEIFEYFNCIDCSDIVDTCQRIATFIFMKKTKRSVSVIEKFLDVATTSNLITDELDIMKQDDSFIENRHDQSIFSVIAKRENIPIYKDPSEYGKQQELLSQSYEKAEFVKQSYPGNYPQLIVLHRKRNVNVYVKIMGYIRSNASWKFYRTILTVQRYIRKLVSKGVK